MTEFAISGDAQSGVGLRGLVADGPAADRADKLRLFGQFVGDWEADFNVYGPDGTVQTTAYTGAAAVKQATAMQQLQRDRDSLAQLVRQLQTRVDRLQRSRR